MAKLRDIASATGVSISTVSKALRGFKEISADTRRKITRTAVELGYNVHEKRSGGGPDDNLGTIGVVCLEIRSGRYAEIVGSLEDALHKRGYSMLLGLSDFDREREERLLDRFLQQNVDGIIFITNSDKIGDRLRAVRSDHEVPVILFATAIGIEDFDYLKVNDDLGIRMALQHLFELGHRNLGFVGDALAHRRLDVFVESLKANRLPVRDEHIRVGKERFEQGGYLRMKEVLDAKDLPTAVVTSYDDVAIGAMRAIDEAGLSVPEDMSIVGMDGIEVTAFLQTPLTTVAAHARETAEAAAQMLLSKVERHNVTLVQHVEFNPELIVRASTAPPKK